MKAVIYILFLLVYGVTQAQAHEPASNEPGNNTVRIQLRMQPQELKDSGKVYFQFREFITRHESEMKRPVNGQLTIVTETQQPALLNLSHLFKDDRSAFFIVSPGDDVIVSSNGSGFTFTGKGAEKYYLQVELNAALKTVTRPIARTGTASMYLLNLNEYFGWTKYYQKRVDIAMAVYNKYKPQLSSESFQWFVDGFLRDAIASLAGRFHTLSGDGFRGRLLRTDTLIAIYDTSLVKAVHEVASLGIDKQLLTLDMRQLQIYRAFGFDMARLPDEAEISMLLLEDLFKTKKGEERERAMVGGLPDAMSKTGFSPRLEKLLQAYYADPAYPEWKQWMKAEETRRRIARLASKTPEFSLVDSKGKLFTEQQLKGKIAVVYFAGNDAGKTTIMGHNMNAAIAAFKNRPDIVFVTVHHETGTTKAGAPPGAKNVYHVYTGGKESNTAKKFVKNFGVGNEPLLYVIDSTGGVVNLYPKNDFTQADGVRLTPFIEDLHARASVAAQRKKDGPYLFDNGAQLDAYTITEDQVAKTTLEKNSATILEVQTDLPKTFRVPLQPFFAVQPAIYPAAEKLLVLSDIEGNFSAFRKLLQQSKVMDENFQWTFGKGHLVFAGDMFDRGTQVTECLWLMYALETQAKAAGGYVHFVLGNHEIMNMQGNHYYTRSKYAKNAKRMGKTLAELYRENTVLGSWLRTKNIMEKIGDILFVHGGISPEVNRLSLGIEDINQLARSAYGQSTIDSSNKDLMTIYSAKYGEKYRISPFWSRAYYKEKGGLGHTKITYAELDTTLAKFGVRRIVTGHTIIADTISVHYGGKVINTDTHHARGHSEALLIEGDRFMRISGWGERRLLFIDDRKRGF